MWFTSDNAGPAAPQIIEAMIKANQGYASAYGADDGMERVTHKLREIFEAPDAAIYLVATGTAANALGLSLLCPPWATIYCHRNAHVEEDECGAPEFYTGGAKLRLLEGPSAKIDPKSLRDAIRNTARAGVHNVQRGALSITNATENGTVYTSAEIAELAKIAHESAIPVHLDGARFANALVNQGCSPAEASWKAGIDVLSFGGTKNGLIGVEAVILFDPAMAWEFELRRKRGGHLVSKHRFLSAQMDAYLTNGLWLQLAAKANKAATKLANAVQTFANAKLIYKTEANAVFAQWPRHGHRKAHDLGAKYYLWPGDQSLDGPEDTLLSARLVCNWATTDAEIKALIAAIQT